MEYQDSGIELESYTVLIPKATAAEQTFGTYNGRTFYYTITSEASFRKNLQKTLKTSNNDANWNAWISGAVNLVMCAADWWYSIPYTFVMNVLGAEKDYEIKTDTYLQYTYRVDPQTRAIYSYTNGVKRISYTDQMGVFDADIDFCPVGTGFSKSYYQLAHLSNQNTTTPNYNNSNSILQLANTYYNHGGQYRLVLPIKTLTPTGISLYLIPPNTFSFA